MSQPRYICIHGHFYQPPRENPWLEAIEKQDSAAPFHDWNERVTAECYEPNATSRILGPDNRITRIVNNYASISFNFGPTLLSWLETKQPDTYKALLQADRDSRRRFSGYGSAMAQAYNHMILPLANTRDRHTQVLWGITDFETRFGRKPEGMWLAEGAVDTPSLELLAEHGIRFTVLSPYSAQRVREMGGGEWKDVSGGRVDPSTPYVQKLPSGRSIVLFFYDGPISQAVAFERLLSDGARFASRLTSGFSDQRSWPQLVHIATDGETYGHHHRHGEMALAYALEQIEAQDDVKLTNYAEFLSRHAPTHEVEIIESSSWSCAHGVERWKSDCGCHSGGKPDWNQAWRKPLREALDLLRDALVPLYEKEAAALFSDPWQARDAYCSVMLDRSSDNVAIFFRKQQKQPLNETQVTQALKLLEMQRHAMLMYTSCGWFFDELSGIETVQIMQYAARAIQLARDFGGDFEDAFLRKLSEAHSNIPELGNGADIYGRFVKPSMVGLQQVAAHFALSSVFENYEAEADVYCYHVKQHETQKMQAGAAKLAVGKVELRSWVTFESAVMSFGALHMGDHNFYGGVRKDDAASAQSDAHALLGKIREPFVRADFPEVIRQIDRHYEGQGFSLKSLFRDEQRRMLSRVLKDTNESIEAVYRQLYERNYALLTFHAWLSLPPPKALAAAAEFSINASLRKAFTSETPNADEIRQFLSEAKAANITIDGPKLGYLLSKTLRRLTQTWAAEPMSLDKLARLGTTLDMLADLPFGVDLHRTQNAFHDVLSQQLERVNQESRQGSDFAKRWLAKVNKVAESLLFHL